MDNLPISCQNEGYDSLSPPPLLAFDITISVNCSSSSRFVCFVSFPLDTTTTTHPHEYLQMSLDSIDLLYRQLALFEGND